MEKFILKSGKMLEFNIATIDQGLALYRAIIYECQKANLDLTQGEDFEKMLINNIPAFLSVIGSENVMNSIIGCCDKVLYNNQRFSKELFEDLENRKDFFGVLQVVAVENLRPFFPSLSLLFNAITSLVLKN